MPQAKSNLQKENNCFIITTKLKTNLVLRLGCYFCEKILNYCDNLLHYLNIMLEFIYTVALRNKTINNYFKF